MDIEERIKALEAQLSNQPQNRVYKTDPIPGSILPSALVATSSPAKGDLHYSDGSAFQNIPIGSTSQLLTVSQGVPVWATLQPDSWTASTDTWVYASASTFTIVGVDRTGVYTKGTRLKFTNSTLKYATVASSSFSTDTTVTIIVNTDYVIANAAISQPFYSYQANPQGYPGFFNVSLSPTGGTGATDKSYFSAVGNSLTLVYQISMTSNATTLNITLPVSAIGNGVGSINIGGVVAQDNNNWISAPGLLGLAVGGTTSATAQFGINATTAAANAYGGFTASNGKATLGFVTYKF